MTERSGPRTSSPGPMKSRLVPLSPTKSGPHGVDFRFCVLREAVRPTRGNSRTELYEGSRPRKVLIADPSEVRQLEGAWGRTTCSPQDRPAASVGEEPQERARHTRGIAPDRGAPRALPGLEETLERFRATQRQLAPLQAAVWPDSRARTVPPNLPCCLGIAYPWGLADGRHGPGQTGMLTYRLRSRCGRFRRSAAGGRTRSAFQCPSGPPSQCRCGGRLSASPGTASRCPPFTQSTNQVAPSATLAQARGRARLQGGRPTAARGAWARRHLHTDEGGLPHHHNI